MPRSSHSGCLGLKTIVSRSDLLKKRVIGKQPNSRMYLKMDISAITDFDFSGEQWQVINRADDPGEIEL